MSHEKSKMIGDSEDNAINPYSVFISMEQLSERLKLLNYEREFCRERHQKPFSRHYFAIPTNPGEQFHNFTSLAAWLINKADGKIDPPQEYDDPNAIVATILDAVRELGHGIEFPPSKLKGGCGEHCVSVLRMLSDSALKIRGHRFELPQYPEELADELGIEENECSGNGQDEDISEWLGDGYGGRCAGSKMSGAAFGRLQEEDDGFAEEEDDAPDLEVIRNRTRSQHSSTLNDFDKRSIHEDDKKLSQITLVGEEKVASSGAPVLQATVDPFDWQLEVERVLPQLRVVIRSDAKDWRAHLEEMRRYQQDVETAYTDVKNQLTRLHIDLNRALDKLSSRERYMNTQVEPLLVQYKSVQDSLSEVTSKYRQASGGITERSRTLAEISEDLERVKTEMDERGSSMTDGSPVVKIKQAIQRLKAEMVGMDIRTGVLEHILLRAHLRVREDSQKPLFTKDVEPSGGSGNATFVY